MKKIFLLNLLCFFSFFIFSQKKEGKYIRKNNFTFAFYNVENLFDTENDPEKLDDEFTPDGKREWDEKRYNKKLKRISKVLNEINSKELPEIIGLCEVENLKVLEDLISQAKLKDGNYGIVHKDSPDMRGIDVALLYRQDEFKVLSQENLEVKALLSDMSRTRDILYVKGKTNNSEIFHIFVNHWSSRRGGLRKTEQKRITAATILRKRISRILSLNPNSKIFIMGDFNDEPTNSSVSNILKANNKRTNSETKELYNLLYDRHNILGEGTQNYKGRWYMFDQLIVSQFVLKDKDGYQIGFNGGHVFNEKFLLYRNTKIGKFVPERTFQGKKYIGGYSDHLPVYMILRKKTQKK